MNHPWFQHYPADVPRDVDTSRYDSLVELCIEACATYSEHRAFGNFSNYLNFSEVDSLSRAFAAYLQQIVGVKRGDRIAIMLPNILQYPVVMLGVLRAGCIVVNTNPQYTPRELQHQMTDSGARAIVVFRNMLSTVHLVSANTKLAHIVVTEIGDLFPFPKSLIYNRVARRQTPKNLSFDIEVTSFTNALKQGANLNFEDCDLTQNDVAFLQYTGGTTGTSKGAILSHGNIISNVLQVGSWFGKSIDRGREIVITALPLYHIYALTVNCFSFFHQGGLNYLITDPRDTKRFVKELRRVKFTGIAGVNTLFQSLLSFENIADVDFSALKYASGGGAAIQRSVAEHWQALTGKIISEGYGLTEASPAVCVNPFEMNAFTGCIGVPLPSTQCKIVNEDGKEISDNEPGELYVRGPQVMQGYWNNPAETAQVLDEDGWLRTGDIATMREDGYFRIVDRKKDLILVSGFNVYPNEIEDVLVQHPQIDEAAAIGVDDERTTEAVKAVIVCRNGEPSKDEIIAHCRAQLVAYKVPRSIEFTDELPKSNIGKILRREVKKQFG